MKRSSLCVCLFLAVAAASAALHAQTPTFSGRFISAGSASEGYPVLFLSGNFNGNGNADLIVGVVSPLNTVTTKFLAGDGAGNFSIGATVNLAPLMPLQTSGSAALVADVNGDGKDDIITLVPACAILPCSNDPSNVATGDGIFTVMLSQGNGVFTEGYVGTLPPGLNVVEGVVGDFNKDGKPDIAVIAHADWK